MTDWIATGTMLAGIGACVGAGAVIYAAHKGADTFKEWRRQKYHERCMAVAEDVLALSYKLKRAFEAIRSPAIFAGEMAQILETLKQSGLIEDDADDASMVLSTAQAALSRVEHNRPLFDALLDNTPVAKAVVGDSVAEQMDVFWSQRAKIVTAAHSYVRDRSELPWDTEAGRRQRERRERNEAILWSGGDENGVDDVANAIDDAISRLENELFPILRSNSD